MAENKQFQSVLDFRPQFENIMDALVPDIQFSYSAIMNNATIQTYFNMICMEYYGYEYFQLLRLNKLELKLSERTLNLTILEIVYNIVTQIVARKWRYSEYIAYDMYILPLRIKKYINAMNYKFIEADIANNKRVLKLVSQPTRIITEEIIDVYHDDKINNIIYQFRSSAKEDLEKKLALFKNLTLFVRDAEPLINQKLGIEFGKAFIKDLDTLDKYNPSTLNEKEKKHIMKVIDDLFNINLIVLLYMSDSMKAGAWVKIREAENRRLELQLTQKTIEEANRRLQAIKKESEEIKKIATSAANIKSKSSSKPAAKRK
ncbi:hypothetical protein SHELI_v1c02770 [Spiroplasma helicoides]|uniref:Uncharacterized protein n=1 Tax=Spiroplasma helicoides TaxID=216938 RepID=A0A1B3SJX8_9MOLU|nr:hypothetical protein [Spiroplasma helicoides]AOG60232.1 hypothetical protein SHELI_v1c02770 [Spiroplasma helicoides]